MRQGYSRLRNYIVNMRPLSPEKGVLFGYFRLRNYMLNMRFFSPEKGVLFGSSCIAFEFDLLKHVLFSTKSSLTFRYFFWYKFETIFGWDLKCQHQFPT